MVPGTLRDSLYILEGLLEQQTSLRPTEIMADTSGVSDIIFGLFRLLGYRFSPRLADIGSARFWRIDPRADYGVLDKFAKHRINPRRIKYHWDDMLRIAGSLKLATVNASELVRSLLKSDRPSELSMALADLGRIPKTIYLLNYIDDQVYRRRILTQLNRGEGRHAVARTICHGQRGEIRKRYREGQEDQLGALGLVTNTVVFIPKPRKNILKQMAQRSKTGIPNTFRHCNTGTSMYWADIRLHWLSLWQKANCDLLIIIARTE